MLSQPARRPRGRALPSEVQILRWGFGRRTWLHRKGPWALLFEADLWRRRGQGVSDQLGGLRLESRPNILQYCNSFRDSISWIWGGNSPPDCQGPLVYNPFEGHLLAESFWMCINNTWCARDVCWQNEGRRLVLVRLADRNLKWWCQTAGKAGGRDLIGNWDVHPPPSENRHRCQLTGSEENHHGAGRTNLTAF